jgi:hypothetical protein
MQAVAVGHQYLLREADVLCGSAGVDEVLAIGWLASGVVNAPDADLVRGM